MLNLEWFSVQELFNAPKIMMPAPAIYTAQSQETTLSVKAQSFVVRDQAYALGMQLNANPNHVLAL